MSSSGRATSFPVVLVEATRGAESKQSNPASQGSIPGDWVGTWISWLWPAVMKRLLTFNADQVGNLNLFPHLEVVPTFLCWNGVNESQLKQKA